MRQALYRKYRSRSFDEVVGQEHVTTTLKRAIESGRISHAYLFTGPKGVGKTSVARILAHQLNGFAYDDDSARLDIIEIDAASNRRIDEIRDLREKIATTPVEGKYKVYIIDEVHMLTREAFNALLKTLEEPPAHIVFILATTEAHKLPETIVSRTQRFEFRPVSIQQAAKHLADIAKQEKIKASPEALEMLAEFGGGSFRDSIGYLDQLSSAGGDISYDDVRLVLGLPSAGQIDVVLKATQAGDSKELMAAVQGLKEQGVEAAAAARAIAARLRAKAAEGEAAPDDIRLLRELIEVPAAARPYDYLEISLLDSASSRQSPKQPKEKPSPQPKTLESAIPAATTEVPAKTSKPAPKASLIKLDEANWPRIVEAVKKQAASLYTALRLAKPDFSDGNLTLKFEFPLHQKKLEQARNKEIIAAIVEELTGSKVKIECLVDKDAFKEDQPVQTGAPEPVEELNSIHNIFGAAAEVLES